MQVFLLHVYSHLLRIFAKFTPLLLHFYSIFTPFSLLVEEGIRVYIVSVDNKSHQQASAQETSLLEFDSEHFQTTRTMMTTTMTTHLMSR